MHEKHRANQHYKKKKKKKKRKPNSRLITKEKRTKKIRKRITSREFPSLRPIKKSSTKRSKNMISETIQVLKSLPIPPLPKTP